MQKESDTSNSTPHSYYPTVASDSDFVAMERDVLQFWQDEHIFEASVEQRPAIIDGQSNAYVFYDGPPFANGLPHHGHLLTGFVKDAFARYQTMLGKRVERRFGWDCHGLPAEMEAEKQLGVSGRQEIMAHGVEAFNNHCRTSVMQYRDDWEAYVNRQARWVDFKNDYKTMDTPYMESVLWAFSELYKKGLIYEGFKVMPYSWAAETVLSSSEIRLDDATREKVDKAVTVAFKLKKTPIKSIPEGANVYICAWTTTPWTLPSNLALAVSKEMEYVVSFYDDVYYIMSKEAVDTRYSDYLDNGMNKGNGECDPDDGWIIRGSDLVGLQYEPLFPYFADHSNAFRILDGSDFIEAGSGTGIVHMAPGFGEDDYRICAANGIDVIVPVDEQGRYTDAIYDLPRHAERSEASSNSAASSGSFAYAQDDVMLSLKGLNVIIETKLLNESEKQDREKYGKTSKFKDDALQQYGLANIRICQYLKQKGHIVDEDNNFRHNYPHCWRTDTPIIYKAMSSWFVDVPRIRDRMVELNQQINWIPDHIKDGRFGKWLENAREWSISRSRFWGCPIPVWRSTNPDNPELYVFGSIAELEAFFDVRVEDLHKPFIDSLTKPDPDNPDYNIARVPEVFDCWFESGSMPYAQVHYPFENKEWFEANYPADFIVEYEAQTRGWFYNMMVLSVALFDQIPFKNCICHGVVLDDQGRKLSKRLKNYMDPMALFESYGSDSLRWFMLSSTIMRGNELFLDPEGAFIRDAVRLYIKPLWNAYHFFCLYANADGIQATFGADSNNIMDRYILAKLDGLVGSVKQAFDQYDTPAVCQHITAFLEVLGNWYIRRCRPRFWKQEYDADKQAAYNTLYSVLHTLCRLVAPLLPQISEAMFAGLTNGGIFDKAHSVHLAKYPDAIASEASSLINTMDRVQEICNAAHGLRNEAGVRIRQPLKNITVYGAAINDNEEYFKSLIADETNVKHVVFSDALDEVATRQLKIDFRVVGKRLGAKMKAVSAAAREGNWTLQHDGSVAIAGELLQSEEFDYALVSTLDNNAAALPAQDGLVVLDTTLDDALRQEGLARDIVRLVQQSRKDAGFDVSDHITLTLNGSDQLIDAAREHEHYICEQTLTDAVQYGAGNAGTVFEYELEGQSFTLAVQQVRMRASA